MALTGGAGCGKSLVAQIFAEAGAAVFDADAIAHELMEPGQPINARIRDLFGATISDSEGRICRRELRAIVFRDPRARRTLEALLHPPIRDALRVRSEGARPYALLVIPLLAETGRPAFVDRVLVVDASPETQAQRLRERGLDDISIQALLAIQATRAARLAMADDVITNDGTRRTLATAIQTLHARYNQARGR
ncbi:MAG: dephospho-CoA kinase [Acidiferrobacter sp.]